MFVVMSQRLGADVREGKRRHFNYIGEIKRESYIIYSIASTKSLADVGVCFLGKLLREVEPDLMDTLINATNQGDLTRIQALIASAKDGADDAGVSDFIDSETESEDEGEVSVTLNICINFSF